MSENGLNRLSTEAIIQGCQSESGHPRSEETGYCFELFRRALEKQEQEAWLAIDAQYRQLILRWGCDYAPDLPHEEIEQIASETLPKFWQSLTKSAEPLTQRFAHIGAVLKYLKQCTLSVLYDYKRQLQRAERIRQHLEADNKTALFCHEPEHDLSVRIEQEQLLGQVREWVQTYVTEKQELQVLFLSYQVGLTPAEIVKRYPQDFPDAQSVRRIKERILKRARRALRAYTR
jgi:hypothetical protein